MVITEGLTAENVQEQLEAGTGDLEFDVVPPTEDIPSLEESPDLVIGPPSDVRFLALNLYTGPFTSRLVREAAEYAVDKNAIVQLDGGPKLASIAGQFILPGNVGYIPRYNPYPDNNGNGDPAKARALLRMAGYPSGVTVKLLYPNSSPIPLMAQSLQSTLSVAGFHVDLRPGPSADLLRELPREPELRQARRMGPGAGGLGPGLARQQRPRHLTTAFYRPRSLLPRFRWLLGPSNRLLDQ